MCVSLSHQEFWRLLLESCVQLVYFSIWLESLLECLLQCLRDRKSSAETSRLYARCFSSFQHMPHLGLDGVCCVRECIDQTTRGLSLLSLFLTQKYCLHPSVNFQLLTYLCFQTWIAAYCSCWMDMEYYTPYFVDCCNLSIE